MNNKRILLTCLCLILYFICSLSPAPLYADEQVSKKFTYYIYWFGIRGGKAELEFITTPENIIVKTHATSAAIVSLFYKVDDTAQSIINADGTPKEYTLKVSEGRHRRHKITEFKMSPEGIPQSAIFHNVLDNEVVEFDLEIQAYDPLSAFYEMSTRDIKIGKSEYIDIFDNKKLYNAEVQVLKKERIYVPAGSFDTIKVKPHLKSEGLFRKTGDIYLWVTDDERKLPVKMTSKAKIGKFRVLLHHGDL